MTLFNKCILKGKLHYSKDRIQVLSGPMGQEQVKISIALTALTFCEEDLPLTLTALGEIYFSFRSFFS